MSVNKEEMPEKTYHALESRKGLWVTPFEGATEYQRKDLCVPRTVSREEARGCFKTIEKTEFECVVVDKTCPKCCPDGDDPDWGPTTNGTDSANCAYVSCGHPLTVITSEKIKGILRKALEAQAGGGDGSL